MSIHFFGLWGRNAPPCQALPVVSWLTVQQKRKKNKDYKCTRFSKFVITAKKNK